MAIKTSTEIMETLRSYLGEDVSDDAIAFIEDMNDTLAEYERQIGDVTDWESKYRELDEEWRKRYRDRFFEGGKDEDGSFIEDANNIEEYPIAQPTSNILFGF